MLYNQTPDNNNNDGERGGFCNIQGRGGQGIASNEGVSALDLPGDLAPGRQMNGTTDNMELQLYGDKTGETEVLKIPAGLQT